MSANPPSAADRRMAAIGPVAPIRNAQPPLPRKVRKLLVAATRAERSIMHFGLSPDLSCTVR
ncbi:hypothetical protein K3740_21735 (plasmid) [Ruegeria conchae]|uniref:hypothetical protein n=1 Tax=Ruegeria conchae TaxID=981384 RepID=UPI0021A44E5E|nr:hypothetical protein [Ruegeria conchae]UWR05219.1 hypothetical protein K3740_21735 [Ruegeria conchae]